MLALIVYTFSVSIYVSATAVPETLHLAPIAIVDEDHSPLSVRIVAAFFPPHFMLPVMIGIDQVDSGLDMGTYTFVLDIPHDFQRDLLGGKNPAIQLNVDATRMSQAFSGNSYIQTMVSNETNAYVRNDAPAQADPVGLVLRSRFNSNLDQAWFGSLMEVITNQSHINRNVLSVDSSSHSCGTPTPDV